MSLWYLNMFSFYSPYKYLPRHLKKPLAIKIKIRFNSIKNRQHIFLMYLEILDDIITQAQDYLP